MKQQHAIVCGQSNPCRLALAAAAALRKGLTAEVLTPPDEPPPTTTFVFRRRPDYDMDPQLLRKQPDHFPNRGRGDKHGKRFHG